MVETLRDALLVTLIVVLAYILYKRLIRFLNRDRVEVENYLQLEKSEVDGAHLKLMLEVPRKQNIVVQVSQGESTNTIFDQELDAGPQVLDLNIDKLAPGSFSCLIEGVNKRIEKFLEKA